MATPRHSDHYQRIPARIAPRPPLHPNSAAEALPSASHAPPLFRPQAIPLSIEPSTNSENQQSLLARNASPHSRQYTTPEPLHHFPCNPDRAPPPLLNTTRPVPGSTCACSAWAPEIEILQRSHSELFRRVEQLSEEVRACKTATATALRTTAREQQLSRDAYILRRTTLLASRNFADALLSSTKELSKRPTTLNEATSVRQTTVNTKAIDCSLYEFRVFARECALNNAISCDLIPSDYYVLNLPASRTEQLQITFPTYYDFCAALDIDIVTRERGLYRQQKNRRNDVRALQIVGIEQKVREELRSGRRIDPQRRVFPGVGTPTTEDSTPRICLFQSNATWSDNSWESSFVRIMDSPRPQLIRVSQSSHHNSATHKMRTSSVNAINSECPVFSVIWKSSARAEMKEGSSEEFSLGLLKCTIPAVVIRGRLLTKDVDAIFSARSNDGKLLTQQIVSPPTFEIVRTE